MKKLILIFAHLLILTSLFAQQNAIWSLPPNYAKFPIIGFPTLLPLPTQPFGSLNPANGLPNYYGQQAGYTTHHAMQDQNGDLLFFIVDEIIYDKNGMGMD
ncbi:MAG: hypothetical protein K0B10_03855 [Vicingaceae bacterium]|nr:hypothetical protein [Vicingaceae bacterium]